VATSIASRELRNDTAAVLRRVQAGEVLLVTVDRRPVAVLSPVARRRQWVAAEQIWDRVRATQADPALAVELDELLDERVAEL